MLTTRSNLALLATTCLFAATFSCAGERRELVAPIELPASFSTTGEGELRSAWWEAFDDPELNQLIEGALTDNLALGAARARIEMAEAVARREGSERYPRVDGSAGADVGWSTPQGFAYGISLGVAASYEVDLWGQVSHRVDAAELDVEALRAELAASGITIAGEIATVWFQLIAARAERELVSEQLATNERWLELVELRFSYGKASATDILRQEGQIGSNAADLLEIESRLVRLEHRLSGWLGQTPGSATFGSRTDLPDPPALPAAGVPSEVLQNRPDVAASFLRVRAADSRLAAAIADQYPRLSIGASARTSTVDVATIFQDWFFGLGIDLSIPIFDGGRLAAEVDRNEAAVDLALFSYGETLLDALVEVEEVLATERAERDLLANLERQLELARLAENQARIAYANGGGNYFEVLDTLRSLERLERSLLNARLSLLLRHIQLHRAVGGTWEGT